MSDLTLHNLEKAIQAHYEDSISDPDHKRHGQGDLVINWVVGYTISNIVDVEGKPVAGFSNRHIAPPSDPNAHVGLAEWLRNDIYTTQLTPPPEEED